MSAGCFLWRNGAPVANEEWRLIRSAAMFCFQLWVVSPAFALPPSVSSGEFSIPASGVEFITGDAWRVKGMTYRLFGVQACIRGTEFQNAAGGVSDCGEASIAYLASLIVDTRPKCRPLFRSEVNGAPPVTYVICQAHVGENLLDLGTIIVTQGFGFAAMAHDGSNWKPVYFPYSVAEAAAKRIGAVFGLACFLIPSLCFSAGGDPDGLVPTLSRRFGFMLAQPPKRSPLHKERRSSA